MKSFLPAVKTAVVIMCLSACFGGTVKTYTEKDRIIEVGLNQEFIVFLNSNVTTGYSWQVDYDRGKLELMRKTYEPSEEAKQGRVGAGGKEYFRFKALNIGETELSFVYKQAWRETTPEDKTKIFIVRIGLDPF